MPSVLSTSSKDLTESSGHILLFRSFQNLEESTTHQVSYLPAFKILQNLADQCKVSYLLQNLVDIKYMYPIYLPSRSEAENT